MKCLLNWVKIKKFQYIRRDYHGLPPLIEYGQDKSIDEKYKDVLNKDILPRGNHY